jgi:hypothetical protein
MLNHLARTLCQTACYAALILLLASSVSYAQRMTGDLSGTVVDETGGVLPGATVVLTNDASGTKRNTVTNTEGFFSFSAVPAAVYTVTIEMQGFSTLEYKNVEVRGGDARTLRTVNMRWRRSPRSSPCLVWNR